MDDIDFDEIKLTKKQTSLLFRARKTIKKVKCEDEDLNVLWKYQLADVRFCAPYNKKNKYDGKFHAIAIRPKGAEYRSWIIKKSAKKLAKKLWLLIVGLVIAALRVLYESFLSNSVGNLFD